jgi:hypothetical protein
MMSQEYLKFQNKYDKYIYIYGCLVFMRMSCKVFEKVLGKAA